MRAQAGVSGLTGLFGALGPAVASEPPGGTPEEGGRSRKKAEEGGRRRKKAEETLNLDSCFVPQA